MATAYIRAHFIHTSTDHESIVMQLFSPFVLPLPVEQYRITRRTFKIRTLTSMISAVISPRLTIHLTD